MREYCRPSTLDEALTLLCREELRSVPLGGGTRLLAESPPDMDAVIDLSDLPLAYIQGGSEELRIGALTRLQQICESPEVCAFAGGILAGAAQLACASVLRNQSTLAGAILSRTALSRELFAAMLILDAEVVLHGTGGPVVRALTERHEDRAPCGRDAILTEVRLRAPRSGVRIGWERIARTPCDQAILSVFTWSRQADDSITECRVSMTGAGMPPRRLPGVEASLVSLGAEKNVISAVVERQVSTLEIPYHPAAGRAYRREMLPLLISRALLSIRS